MHPEIPLVAACNTINLGAHEVKRWLRLEAEIKALFARFKPELMIIETNFVYKNPRTTGALNQLLGGVRLLAAVHGVQVQFIDNNTTKRHVLGNTKYWNGEKYVGVTKEMMKTAITSHLCEDSMSPPDDNAADAIAIAFTYWDVRVNHPELPKSPPKVRKPRVKHAQ